MKKNKTILLISILAIIILGVIGVAYAYSTLIIGTNQQLVLGDIYMHYKETNELVLEDAIPSETYDTSKYFEFTINGKNTYQDKDIYYEIVLNHGDDHTTRTERIKDNLLKFTLVEIKDSTETIVVNGESFDEINKTRLWANTISKNTTNDVNVTYRLYMWMSDETTICGGGSTGCDYDIDTWNDEVYASIKVNVNGDFAYKTADRKAPVITSVVHAGEGKITFTATDDNSGVVEYCVNQERTDTTNCTWLTAIEGEQTTDVITTEDGIYYVHVKDRGENIGHSKKVIIALTVIKAPILGVKVSNYLEATDETFTGGLVAINGKSGDNYGDVYNENDTTQIIREYRYSGADVNNYIIFNDDGDGVTETNELWRIIGLFKNSSGNWNLKLVRNSYLTNDELPTTYTYNETDYTIKNDSGKITWSSSSTSYLDDNWQNVGIQYYLNGTDGYLGTFTTKAKNLIDQNYKYYLGNLKTTDTMTSSYESERGSVVCSSTLTINSHNNNCDIWYGFKSTWNGAIALLYNSDIGYSSISIHWDKKGANTWLRTNWMHETGILTANGNITLSPSSYYKGYYTYYTTAYGPGQNARGFADRKIIPVLNLLSTASIDTDHTGSQDDPYTLLGT